MPLDSTAARASWEHPDVFPTGCPLMSQSPALIFSGLASFGSPWGRGLEPHLLGLSAVCENSTHKGSEHVNYPCWIDCVGYKFSLCISLSVSPCVSFSVSCKHTSHKRDTDASENHVGKKTILNNRVDFSSSFPWFLPSAWSYFPSTHEGEFLDPLDFCLCLPHVCDQSLQVIKISLIFANWMYI